jgi:hypothetical protein
MAIVKHRPTFEILPSEADGYLHRCDLAERPGAAT